MKLTELIKKLQHILDTKGDKDLYFTVKDYFTVYDEEMNLNLKVGNETGMPSDFEGYTINGNGMTIKFTLNENFDSKKPEVIFRKYE